MVLPISRREVTAATLLALSAATAATGVTFDRAENGRCGARQRCVPITECSDYRSSHDIRRRPPTICGFRGAASLVCCEALEPATDRPTVAPPATPSPVSEDCGVTMAIFDAPKGEFFAAGFNGFAAVRGRWPWMALFGRWSAAGLGDWFCGGVLVSRRYLLTAAHCVRPEQAGAIGVRIGDHTLSKPDEVEHQERNVSAVLRHPQYAGSQNDISLVRLDRPVDVTKTVRPICLPPAGQPTETDLLVEMAGWGRLEFAGNTPDVLQKVPLRVSDVAECERAHSRVPQFDSRFPGGFQGTKVCALSRDEVPRDACPGDSGGPLLTILGDSRRQLVGIVSTGVGCGNPEFPGIYTRVSAYIDWILETMQ